MGNTYQEDSCSHLRTVGVRDDNVIYKEVDIDLDYHEYY